MENRNSISLNILRAALFLISLGFILPLGCKSTGFEVAQGILGNYDLGKGEIILSSVNDFYAYLLYAVFIIAAVGLIITFVTSKNYNFSAAFICLIISLIFMFIILMKLKVYFNFNEFSFYVNFGIPQKIELLFGGYAMIIGYISGICVFILNILKIIK
jgi:hypothetical protein